MRALVFALTSEELLLSGRTMRSLQARGIAVEAPLLGQHAVAAGLNAVEEPVLLLQCGCWLEKNLLAAIPSSSTGRPLIAYGRTIDDPAWAAGKEAGDDLDDELGGALAGAAIPTPRCLYFEPASARRMAELLQSLQWDEAVHKLLSNETEFRAVRIPELAHRFNLRLRILQVVTTIQYGGAERVTLELADGLTRRGNACWVAALGKPTRKAYPSPRGFFDLSATARDSQSRADAVQRLAHQLNVDAIHAHLITAAESEALYRTGVPLAVTLHNMPQSWPKGFAPAVPAVPAADVAPDPESTPTRKAGVIIACSQSIRKAAAAAFPNTPCRTAWNGVAAGRYEPTPDRLIAGRCWREGRGWASDDLVLIAVANARLQKQLHRIPEIMAELQAAQPARKIRCILAGEPAQHNADAAEAQALLEEACGKWLTGVLEGSLIETGSSEDVDVLLAAADVFVSVSAFEGLSLAQLEALAAGLPVVATDVGGADEIAREMGEHAAFYRRLPDGASAGEFARAITEAALAGTGLRCSRLPRAFQKEKMTQRVEQIYTALVAACASVNKRPEGLWIVTNNFSMGGAQSSARRLLETLKARGVRVRAFTVQEEEATRGSLTLMAAGIPVTLIPPSARLDPSKAAARIAAESVEAPPRAVLFWNLIASYKMLLADAFGGFGRVRVFDVSPGEMCFQSLDAYFQKPREEMPYRTGSDYGANLAGAVVKYAREKQVAEEVLGIPVSVIRNGVPLHRRPAKPPGSRLIFGTASRITPDKRLEDLIAAFAMAHQALPRYELHIAGKIEHGADAYAAGLREAGRSLPVVWRGELPGTTDFFQELDIFVMISEPAGCPNASLEAMAAGLPVIATDVGGAHEQVIDRVNGRLVPPRNTSALAVALIELAHHSKAQLHYGMAGQTRIANDFSLEAMVDAYQRLCLAE